MLRKSWRLLLPGKEAITGGALGWLITALIGMGGALLGTFIARSLWRGENYTAGWIMSVIGAVLLSLNWMLGRQQRNPSKLAPYESGVPLLDENRKRINVRFYQIAMLFILFDIEAAFLYPWAVIYRDAAKGPAAWFIFTEMLVFILLLAVGYVYVWKKKTFDWA